MAVFLEVADDVIYLSLPLELGRRYLVLRALQRNLLRAHRRRDLDIICVASPTLAASLALLEALITGNTSVFLRDSNLRAHLTASPGPVHRRGVINLAAWLNVLPTLSLVKLALSSMLVRYLS